MPVTVVKKIAGKKPVPKQVMVFGQPSSLYNFLNLLYYVSVPNGILAEVKEIKEVHGCLLHYQHDNGTTRLMLCNENEDEIAGVLLEKEYSTFLDDLIHGQPVNVIAKGSLRHSARLLIKKALLALNNPKPQKLSLDDPSLYKFFTTHYLEESNFVQCIKNIRLATGCSLYDAKHLVDTWKAEYHSVEAQKTDSIKTTPGGGSLKYDANTEALVGTKPVPNYTSLLSETVQLGKAQQLHQPVFGSDPGSIYHVVAISADVIVAARIRSNYHLAIRVLPRTIKAKTGGWEAAGLSKKDKGHWSIHLEAGTLPFAQKCLGAVLFSLDASFHSISDAVQVLVGVGK